MKTNYDRISNTLIIHAIEIYANLYAVVRVLMTGGTLTVIQPAKPGRKPRHFTVHGLWSPARRRVSFGNGKTGLPSVSTLAGTGCYNGAFPLYLKPLLSYFGGFAVASCNSDCPGCYAKTMTRFPSVAMQLLMNTIECRINPDRFYAMAMHEIDCYNLLAVTPETVIRIHDSGDFMTPAEYMTVVRLCHSRPAWTFGTYTKRYDIVAPYGRDYIPDNLVMSCSPWKDICGALWDLQQFIWDDHTSADIMALPHCPAVNRDGSRRKGVTCKKCMHCYTKHNGARWAVHDHGAAVTRERRKREKAAALLNSAANAAIMTTPRPATMPAAA